MLTALDQIANQNHLQLVKAALPYMQSGSQKLIAVFVKLLELQNILRFYRRCSRCVGACSSLPDSPGMIDVLTDIRNYCEGEEQALMDQWIQILSAMELYSMFTQSPEEDGAFREEDAEKEAPFAASPPTDAEAL